MSLLNVGTLKTTVGVQLPIFNDNTRPSNPELGLLIYNTDSLELEVYGVEGWSIVGREAGLFEFDTFTFTSAGERGKLGPAFSAITSDYASRGAATWATNTTYFTQGRTEGFQLFTVPSSGTYTIEVAGARGQIPNDSYDPSFGAIISADVELESGMVLEIVVGQTPFYTTMQGQAYQSIGAGGGGSFVSLYTGGNSVPLVCAGGGGGGYPTGAPATQYRYGQTSRIPLHHYNGTNLSNVSLTAGYGGKGWDAGGAGGYYGDGQAWGWGGNSTTRQGQSSGDGIGIFGRGITATASTSSSANRYAAGGYSNLGNNNGYEQYKAEGGFGGGGGGDTGYNAGGGGGGYTGGWSGGGYLDSSNGTGLNQWGVGGGSFIIASATNVKTSDGKYDNVTNFSGAAITQIGYNNQALSGISSFTTGQGYVKITKL